MKNQENFVSNLDVNKFTCFYAIVKFFETYSFQEFGGYEVNIKAIARWLCSTNFFIQSFDFKNDNEITINIDKVYKFFEKDILNGAPVWRFLNLPKKLMMDLEFKYKIKMDKKQKKKTTKNIDK